MRSYRIGDAEIDDRISALVSDVAASRPDYEHDEELIREMIVTALKLVRDDAGRAQIWPSTAAQWI